MTPMTGLSKVLIGTVVFFGFAAAGIKGAYWWSNVPPKRPPNVAQSAVFLWAGHLGLPAPKRGTWLECWADQVSSVNKCKLTEMNGNLNYRGVFLANTGKTPVPQSDLNINSEQTSQSVDLWVRAGEHFAPLIFLQNGTVLIPKDAYDAGMTKLKQLRREQGKA